MATPPKKPPAKPKPATPPAAAKRPAQLAHGRWLGDLEAEEPLSTAEEHLVARCGRGELWHPEGWDWENPVRPDAEAATPANTIRASLIRFLALGGDADHPVHEEGIMVLGAWIKGVLNLHQCRTRVRLDLEYCHFAEQPDFGAAQLPELALSGSWIPGLHGDRLRVTGGLFLREGFKAAGEVRLLGAQIGGNLECSGGTFSNPKDNALSADRISVTGSVFLRDGFEAAGEVWLLGAQIGGDLDLSGGTFSNPGGDALSGDGIRVQGNLFLRKAEVEGAILLSSAKIGSLLDDAACWESKGHNLNGLHYDRIVGPTDAASRIKWLKTQRADFLDKRNWRPQPWEHLIKTLREMGHPAEAAEVAVEKQRMMRRAKRIGTRQPRELLLKRWKWLELGWIWLINFTLTLWHFVYEALAGFGYRPGRILLWMLAVWTVGGLYFGYAARTGLMAPTHSEIVMHRQIHEDIGKAEPHAGTCGLRHEVSASHYWPDCAALPSEYTTFNPWLYSLDLILPLVDLQQDSDWAPAATFTDAKSHVQNLTEGQYARALMWFEILFGWFASLMFVAIVSRLVEKD